MIVINILLSLAVIFIVLFAVLSIHEKIYDNNANYAYWSSKARIRKVTYGNGNVEFIAEINKIWGFPFCWEKIYTSVSFEKAECQVNHFLNRISSKRIIKSTKLHARHNN